MGRPSKLDDITAQRIVQAVEKGLPRDTAARLARISPTTLYKYLRLGRDGDPEYTEFAKRVKAAEASGEAELLGILRAHAAETWQAAAWLLERRMPKKYALRRPEAPIEAVSPEEGQRLIEAAAKLHAETAK
jgi:hypothetical protein